MRKFFDIIPPQEKKKVGELSKKKPEFKIPKIQFKKGLSLVFLIFLILIGTGIIAYFNLPRAEIEIWPETEILPFKTKLTVDKDVKNIDFLNGIIPGKIFKIEKTVSKQFLSSGQKLIEKKAEGIIRVYNNSSRERTLIPSRFQPPLEKFLSPLGKGENPWFWSQNRITISPKSYQDVKVVASAPGKKYNIEPTKFSLPALAGTPSYTLLYGESFQKFKGGLKKKVKQVTAKDLERAENTLTKKVKQESETTLKNKISAEFDFLSSAMKTEILETFSTTKPGVELENFTFQVKARSRVLAFKKDELENFLVKFILSQISPQKKIHHQSLKINYSLHKIDFKTGKMTLSLNSEAKIYPSLDEISLKKNLIGKSLAETKFFLKNFPQVSQVKVKFWPFWVKKVPEKINKIKINLNLD